MRKLMISGAAALTLGLAGCDYVPTSVQNQVYGLLGIETSELSKGEFKGDLVVQFFSGMSGDGQPIELIMLIQPFGYTDSKGIDWDVPAGYLSNGASIPASLWAILGGPFSGPYRDAAVIHDYYCETQDRPWKDVHEMFLEAAVSRGTDVSLAKTMYAGILFGGPRWGDQQSRVNNQLVIKAQATPTGGTTAVTADDGKLPFPVEGKSPQQVFKELQEWIMREKPSKEIIDAKVKLIREATTKK